MFKFLVTALLASASISSTDGCIHHLKKRESSSGTYPEFTTGTDGPADSATIGFTIGHLALLVNDLAATSRFYGDVLGMRHIFTFNSSEEYTIMYMGHAQGGKNGTGYMTGEDMFSEIYNMEGLIEFIEFKNSSNPRIYTTGPRNSFSHFGLVVPNIQAAQSRMDTFGVTILKRVGDTVNQNGEVPLAFGMPGPGPQTAAALAGLVDIGFDGYMIIADPDGNVIEVLQQD